MLKMMHMAFTCLFVLHLSNSIGQTTGGEPLTIESAVQLALKNNPELKTLQNEIKALEAVKIQSGLIPNPEIGIEAENIFGNKNFTGLDNSEITTQISQNILLAGKISKRIKVAESDISLAEWDYETKRIELITKTRIAFQQALSARIQIRKNQGLITISEEFIVNLNKRVEAGKISPAEVSRARIILNALIIDLNRLKSEYKIQKSELFSLIYQPGLVIDSLAGELQYPHAIPQYDSLLVLLNNNPQLKRYESEYERQKAVIALEESKAIPNVTISAGYKRLNDVKVNTYLIGAFIALPFFNRNQGAIQEAQIRLGKRQTEFESVKNRLSFRLKALYNLWVVLAETAGKLKEESIPEAEKAFEIIKEGSLSGRFAIIDVLDAERTLFGLQNQYLDITGQMHTTQTEIEGLIGKEIE